MRVLWLTAFVPLLACGVPDNAGLTTPPGFRADRFADNVRGARHLTVAPNGDVIVALDSLGPTQGVLVLRDLDGDFRSDTSVMFGAGWGNDVVLRDGFLYYSTFNAVLRYPWHIGAMQPTGPADTILSNLPFEHFHSGKTIAFDTEGWLYVNIGSPSNVCTLPGADEPGTSLDPCPELETRAGIWRFDANTVGQTQADGERYATGVRNAVALRGHPTDGNVYAVIHGRDRLSAKYPHLYDDEANAELPAEEFVRVQPGANYGYPYCYFDHRLPAKVLAPEYGGDGTNQGRCADMTAPLMGFPGHWAPNDLLFYQGNMFPARYHNGAFVAFHGSWNRAPLPQAGYQVTFVPFAGGNPTGEYEVFADGFARDDPVPWEDHRPLGLAEGPDGSLYIGDDVGGWIYRITYEEPATP